MLALVAAAFLIRWPSFGSPTYKLDEQFYLYAGDRLLHGALPYVDFWDRKPIGLFLIFAAIRALGGAGFAQYQMIATLFAAGTAGGIFLIVRRIAGLSGGLFGGVLYLLWIEMVEGGGGQAPVFYNFPMALAAFLTFTAIGNQARGAVRRRAFGAMALVGIAIQIKYTAMFEGLFFGLVLSAQAWRRMKPFPALAETALLALTALAPTLLAFGCYLSIGEGRAFWFANFVSIFQRGGTAPHDLAFRFRMSMLHILPLICCGLVGAWHLHADRRARAWQWFTLGWLVAALIGFLSVGVLYSHYLLPMFVPLCAVAAPAVRRWPTGVVFAAITAYLPASLLDYPNVIETRHSHEQLEALAALVPPDVRTGCMQMFSGPPSLYLVTHACTRTPYVFQDHLVLAMERDAIGVDQAKELARLLATRPRVIVKSPWSRDPPRPSPVSIALIDRALADGYRLAGTVPVDGLPTSVFVRK